MILGRQKRAVEALSAELAEKRERRDDARLALARQKRSFFSNPVNLLLPLCAGALATMLLTRRKARSSRRADAHAGFSIAPVVSMASAFWTASRSLREELGWDTAELVAKARELAASSRVSER